MTLVPHLAPYHFFYAPNDIRRSFTQAAPVSPPPGAVFPLPGQAEHRLLLSSHAPKAAA